MSDKIYGWCGKILRVDLSDSSLSELNTMDYAERFLGGRGIGTRIYWDEVGPEIGALDPENHLILMTGPLGATGAQGASRVKVIAKSPMTTPERFCYGNLGGYFGPFLKKAGFDGIIVKGRAQRLSYIWINDGKVEIRDAATLQGKGVYQVRDLLQATHGKDVHFVATGLAGENMCRAATLMTDHEGSATGGFGAVMGSKNLKAIAVVGTSEVAVAKPHELAKLNRLTIQLSKRGDMTMFIPSGQSFVKRARCYQCGLDCIRNRVRTESGKEGVRKCQASGFYSLWADKRADQTGDINFEATAICNDLSLCTIEMSRIVKWLEDCLGEGSLTQEETGLRISDIGSQEFISQLANMIAHREGFGAVLAEGLYRAAKILGHRTNPYLAEVQSQVGGVRGSDYAIISLLRAFEPRESNTEINEMVRMLGEWFLHRALPELSPASSDAFRAAATAFWGNDKAWDLTTYEGKAEAAVRIQDRSVVNDSLVLCCFNWPVIYSFDTPNQVGDPTLESKLFSSVTGIDTDEVGLRLYGERIFNLQRAILLREGWRAKDSDKPMDLCFSDPSERNMGEPATTLDATTFFFNHQMIVPGEGESEQRIEQPFLDKERFETMRDEYYKLRGWSAETGFQKEETLARVGLSDLVLDLQSKKLIHERAYS